MMTGRPRTIHDQAHPIVPGRLRILGMLLCGILFSAGISVTKYSLINNRRMLYHELAFIILHTVFLRALPPFGELIKRHRAAAICLGLWSASVLVSLLVSPYQVAFQPGGITRFLGTLVHVVFIVYVWDFFRRAGPTDAVLTAAIPLSAIYVAIIFVLAWYGLYGETYPIEHRSDIWWSTPPVNVHIRHTGYFVVAALATALALFASESQRRLRPSTCYAAIPILTILWTFIFWLGGRGAILAAGAVVLTIAFVLRRHGKGLAPFMAVAVGSAVIGCILAEMLAVFPWNGLLPSVRRTTAIPSLNIISTGRYAMWKTTLAEFIKYPLFGMGPEGYRYMPGRLWGVQPHCMLVQFLVEWGMVGTMFFLIVLFSSIRTVFSRLINTSFGLPDARRLVGGALICALTVHGLTDGTYYHGQPSLYLALGFGMGLLPVRDPGLPSRNLFAHRPRNGVAGNA